MASEGVHEATLENNHKVIAVDFARFGDDYSVIYQRKGLAIVDHAYFAKSEIDVVVARAFEMQEELRWQDSETIYVFDADGMGQGAVHLFKNAGKRYLEFHNGRPARRKAYHDRITEGLFHLARLVKDRKVRLPYDRMLLSELSTRQYAMTVKGAIKAESKDEYRKRVQTGSPDRADTAVMAFYPYMAAGRGVVAED